MLPILTSLIFIPLVGAFIILLLPRKNAGLIKSVALVSTALVLGLASHLVCRFDHTTAQVQFTEKIPWIAPMNIWYFVGVDGLSLALVFLTALLGFIACIASFNIDNRQKEYFVFLILVYS